MMSVPESFGQQRLTPSQRVMKHLESVSTLYNYVLEKTSGQKGVGFSSSMDVNDGFER